MNEIKIVPMPISTVCQNITTIIFSLLLHSFHGGKKNSRCSSHLNLHLKINMESTQLALSPMNERNYENNQVINYQTQVINSITNPISNRVIKSIPHPPDRL